MTDRKSLDDMTSDDLDQLYDDLDRAETEARERAEADSADAAAGSYALRAERAEQQRDQLAAVLTEILAAFHPVRTPDQRTITGYTARITPADHQQWTGALGQAEGAAPSSDDLTVPAGAPTPDYMYPREPCPHCDETPHANRMDEHVQDAHADLPECTARIETEHRETYRCSFRAGHAKGEYGKWHASKRGGELGSRYVWNDSAPGARPHQIGKEESGA